MHFARVMTVSRYQDDEVRWASWMAAAQHGNKGAYEELLTELADVIGRYLVVRFGKLRGLEDLVQECLLAVHSARHTYHPQRAFRPWMFTVLRHRAIDVLRRRNSRVEEVPANFVAEATALDADNLTQIIDGEQVLSALKPEQREAVVLTHYLGMTASEAAASLKISESALKARLRRGLKAAQNLINDDTQRQKITDK